MSNGIGPIPERPQDFSLIKNGICITSGDFKGCIKVGAVHYWLSRKRDSPYYWLHNTDTPGDSMVYMTSDVWDRCQEGGKYTYSEEVQGWVDSEEEQWRWDGQPGKSIFLSNDFEL